MKQARTKVKETLGSSLIIGCLLMLGILIAADIKGPTVGGMITFLLVVPIFTVAVIVYFYMHYKEWKEKRQS